MIDTHCHLLWRLDDGPKTAIASMDLARSLVRQGVTTVLCTPHYSARFPTSHDVAGERLEELRRDLAALEIPLHTMLGAEIHFRLALSGPLEEIGERSIGGFAIVELEGTATAATPVAVHERLAEVGLVPIFAHPERSAAVRGDFSGLDEARAGGALVQVLASSLAHRRGSNVAEGASALLDTGRADLFASDAHGARGTASRLRSILDAMTKRYGADAVDRLTKVRPAEILKQALA
jgi:protein-tyrosine phosphatase